jgi:hypothetical protein
MHDVAARPIEEGRGFGRAAIPAHRLDLRPGAADRIGPGMTGLAADAVAALGETEASVARAR